MNWVIEFHPQAIREIQKLDPDLRRQVLSRMQSRFLAPEVPKARLSGPLPNTYKIKLKKAGFRVVYQILLSEGKIRVLALGRRDSQVYDIALLRGSGGP